MVTLNRRSHLALIIMVVTAFATIFVLDARPALGDMESTAESWAEGIAGANAEDFLNDLEVADIRIEENVRNQVKGALKNFIKNEILNALIGANISIAMESILHSIRDSLRDRRGDPCQLAAMDVAWTAVNVNRALRGAAHAFPEILTAAAGVPEIIRNINGWVAEQVREAAIERLREYLQDYNIETFSETSQVAGCKVSVQVIWLKHQNQFHYLIIGDCNCNSIAIGNANVKLSRWSIRGFGRARWVGAERERAIARQSNPESTIRGSAVTTRVIVQARCCDANNRELATGRDPWNLSTEPQTPRPQTGDDNGGLRTDTGSEPEEEDRTPRTVEEGNIYNRAFFARPKPPEIPEIPAASVCPDEKNELLHEAAAALGNARTKLDTAEGNLNDLDKRQQEGEEIAQDEWNEANENLSAAEEEVNLAQEALDAAEDLEIEECDNSDHEHSCVPLDESRGATAHTVTRGEGQRYDHLEIVWQVNELGVWVVVITPGEGTTINGSTEPLEYRLDSDKDLQADLGGNGVPVLHLLDDGLSFYTHKNIIFIRFSISHGECTQYWVLRITPDQIWLEKPTSILDDLGY